MSNCIFRVKENMIRDGEFVCSDLFGYYSTWSAAKKGIEQRIDFRTKNCDCDYSILYADDVPSSLCFKPDENGNSDARLDYYIVKVELDIPGELRSDG